MANTLYTAQQAARSTLAAVRYLTVLPRTVRQDFSSEFVAGRGRTIDVPLPIGVGAARTYTQANRTARDAIVFDDISQDSKPITLSDQVYKAVQLPDDLEEHLSHPLNEARSSSSSSSNQSEHAATRTGSSPLAVPGRR